MPIMYVGTDGRLYAQFWTGSIAPLISPTRVNDGQWHTATLVLDGTYHNQALFLDNNVPEYTTYNLNAQNSGTNIYIGAGVFNSGGWIDADTNNGSAGTTRPSYFPGQISDVAFFTQTLADNQIAARGNQPTPMNGTIQPASLTTKCIDYGSGTAGSPVTIYDCAGRTSNQWTFSPNHTITIAGTGTGAAGSGKCITSPAEPPPTAPNSPCKTAQAPPNNTGQPTRTAPCTTTTPTGA